MEEGYWNKGSRIYCIFSSQCLENYSQSSIILGSSNAPKSPYSWEPKIKIYVYLKLVKFWLIYNFYKIPAIKLHEVNLIQIFQIKIKLKQKYKKL